MGKVLKFPNLIAPLAIHKGSKHSLTVEVVDTVRPRRTRWLVQFEIQEAAGFRAIRGFKDIAVAAGLKHNFHVTSTRAVRQFVAQTAELVTGGKIRLWVDGARVLERIKRQA